MQKNNPNITLGKLKLRAMLLWAYNYGKNDGGETSFKRERDEKVEKII